MKSTLMYVQLITDEFKPQRRGRLYSNLALFGASGDVRYIYIRARHRNPPEAFRSRTDKSLQPGVLQELQEPSPMRGNRLYMFL